MSVKKTTRRDFLKVAGVSSAAAGIAPAWIARAAQPHPSTGRSVAPSDRIGIATIGLGIQGNFDTRTALQVEGVELVAVADCYDGRLARARETYGEKITTTRHYQELLTRDDIDAVIIATPDHWHGTIAVEAMKAGKDVYVEKPMVQKIEEGPTVIATARETGRVLQVGSQRVSSQLYLKAKEWFEKGVVGELNSANVVLNRNSAIGAWQYSLPLDATPEAVDWKQFLGPAPDRPFDPVRFFRWRNYRDYGTGIPGDLFIHLFSGVHFMLSSHGPNRVMSSGGLHYWKDGRDVPDLMMGICDYPETASHPAFHMALQVNFADGGGGGEVVQLIGNEGVLTLGYTELTLRKLPPQVQSEDEIFRGYNSVMTFSSKGQADLLADWRAKNPDAPRRYRPADPVVETYKTPEGYDEHLDHFRNFFNAVRSRGTVVEDAVFGYRAAAPALLSNDSYFNRKIYEWDPEAMKIVA